MRLVTLFHGWSLAGAYASMFIIGLLMSIYGPIIGVLQGRFDLSSSAAGAALGTQSLGAVLGVLLAQPFLRRVGNRTTIMTALLLTGLGSAGIAIAPSWTLVILGTGIAGLGFGVIDSVITQLILIGSGVHGPGRTNIAHAWFGIGTVSGPGFIYLVGANNYSWIFLVAAVISALAMISMTGLAPRPTPVQATTVDGDPATESGSRTRSIRFAVVSGFLILYLTHFAVQSGIGNWGPTVLEHESGLDSRTATLVVSGYWAAMVLGRFIAAFLMRRLSTGVLVTLSALGLFIALALSPFPAIAPAAMILAGLFIGPIFPTGLAWLAASGHGRGNTFAYVIAGSMLGMALAPYLLGWQIESFGTGTVPLFLILISACVLVTAIVLKKLTAPNHASHATPNAH